jgi:uncharacterized protein (UPF0335 family)
MSGDQLDILLNAINRLENSIDKIAGKLDNQVDRVVRLEEQVKSVRGTFKYIGSFVLATVGSIVWMVLRLFTGDK